MITIQTIDRLMELVRSSDQPLYVRWSRGPAMDRNRRNSRDYSAGREHKGLSSVRINPDWCDDPAYLLRRVREYRFLRIKDAQISGYLYQATELGTDSDGYQLITDIVCIGKLGAWTNQ